MGSTPVASGHKAGITGLALDGTTSETWQLGSDSADRWRLSGATGAFGAFTVENRRSSTWNPLWYVVDYGSGFSANIFYGITSLAFNYDAVDAPQNVLTLTANKLTTTPGAGYGVSFTMQAEDSTTEYVGLGGAAWSWTNPVHVSRSSKAVLSVVENAISVDALTITGTGINATPIGSTTASTGTFTTLIATGGSGTAGSFINTPTLAVRGSAAGVVLGLSAPQDTYNSAVFEMNNTASGKRWNLAIKSASNPLYTADSFVINHFDGSSYVNQSLVFTPSGRVGIGYAFTPATILHAALSSATTNSVENVLTIEKKLSSGTSANGLGAGINFLLQSTTTASRDAGSVFASWVTATDASRVSKISIAPVSGASQTSVAEFTPTQVSIYGLLESATNIVGTHFAQLRNSRAASSNVVGAGLKYVLRQNFTGNSYVDAATIVVAAKSDWSSSLDSNAVIKFNASKSGGLIENVHIGDNRMGVGGITPTQTLHVAGTSYFDGGYKTGVTLVGGAFWSSYKNKVLSYFPYSFYYLVGATNPYNDLGKHSLHGSVSGGVTANGGVSVPFPEGGNGALFNGSSGYISLPLGTNSRLRFRGATELSFVVWFAAADFADGVGRSAYAISSPSSYLGEGGINFCKRPAVDTIGVDHSPSWGDYSGSASGTGYHGVGYSFKSSSGKTYVNGSLVDTRACPSSLVPTGIGIHRIGYLDGGLGSTYGASYWNGSIAVVASFERQLPDEAMQSLTTATAQDYYYASSLDNSIFVDASNGNFTVYLPSAVSEAGLILDIKKVDSSANTVTIDADGTETIDGDLTKIISSQWTTVSIKSNGTGWYIL